VTRLVPTALVIMLAVPAAAAPPPHVAPHPARFQPEVRIGRVCGAGLQDAGALLQAHLARAASAVQPTTFSIDHDHVAVLEDDGTFFYTNKGGGVIADPTAIAQAFYRTHGDDYDHLAIYLASGLTTYLGSPTALAASFPLRNATLGIGLSAFDVGAGFGSPARLEDILSMNGLHRYLDDPWATTDADSFTALDFLGHEFGHRWLAYIFIDSAGFASNALLGRDEQHWSFFADVDGSIMEGSDWAQVAPDSFRTVGVTTGYGRLDQYLMGLRPATAIDSFFTLDAPTAFDPAGAYDRTTDPFVGLGCRAQPNRWTIDNVVAENGPRVPDAASAPHAFRCAVILVTPHGSDATAHDLAKADSIARGFERYFPVATSGLGTVRTDLDSHPGTVCFSHAPLPDIETSAPRTVAARVFVSQGSAPTALDPVSVRVFLRSPPPGPYTPIAMTEVAPDSFEATLPALPGGATAQYYLSAADTAGNTVTDPPGGAAAPFTYHVGADLTPPTVVHAPVPRQGAARMPQRLLARVTDNLGVDSVWVEASVDGAAPVGVAVSPAGRDSFAAPVGAGLAAGHWVAYRFVARDRAAAHNQGYSNPAFDTLRVQQDWTDEFENGDDGFTHALYWFSYRDAWHLSQRESSPPGGTAWVCGRDDSLPYPPHLDANLYTPAIAGITAGTRLQFDHRYDLEEQEGTGAWDGARLEISVNGGAWQVLTPVAGYDHEFLINDNPFQRGTPCWSGGSGGWRTDVADLSPYAPGPVRVRFRMLADDLVGYRGWTVDRIRLIYGGSSSVPVTAAPLELSAPWPNPARDAVHLSGALPHAGRLRWALYDVGGRSVGVLWQGAVRAGAFAITGAVPHVRAGLYFGRVEVDGRLTAAQRIAVVK
jgi:hypothetical protein